MKIWNNPVDIEEINTHFSGTMCGHLGIKVIEVGDDFVKATMPVDERTMQHMGILHGGGSVVLAESVGGLAAGLCCKEGYTSVGMDINANHLRGGTPPFVTAIARPFHIGKRTSVWEIKITDTDDKLICISRLTMAFIKKR